MTDQINITPSRWILSAWILLALVAVLLAIFIGVVDIPPADTLATLMGHGSPEARSIILDIRLPRIFTGMLAGMHLAVAGLIFQTMTRNPMADPSIMGVSQGATLTVTIFLLFTAYRLEPGKTSVVELPVEWLPTVGTLGGLAAGAAVYLLALRRNVGPMRITLCGIAIGALLHAIAIGLFAGWGSHRIEIVLEWISGSLYARGWKHVLFLLPYTIVGAIALPMLRRTLDLLRFEETVARSFGLAYRSQFTITLGVACCLAASAVGVVGPIIFVGLICPHLARFMAGRRISLLMPLTAALGMIVVTLGDLVGRMAGQALEIPIGIVTAACGVPVLIALLRRAS